MVKNLFFAFALVFCSFASSGQYYKYQYFDGADTVAYNSIFVTIDTTGGNVWQIGRPQKTIFDSAATSPNVIVTDTINTYPVNDSSEFLIAFKPWYTWGILAIRWKQKLDFDKKHDGGMVEFSIDSGATWQNVFNNPLSYNFYGFNAANKDTLVTGEYAFSGRDTVWRDVWLCFDYSFLSLTDSVMLRFKLKSDTADSANEGWMIDNMMMHITMAHTLTKKIANNDRIEVYPTVTSGIINIEAPKARQFHIIEKMQLIDVSGRVMQEYSMVPTKYYIDIGGHPNGTYYLKIKTNLYSGTFPVVLSK